MIRRAAEGSDRPLCASGVPHETHGLHMVRADRRYAGGASSS